MNQFQPTTDKEHIKEVARQQSIFYQIVLYRCLIVVQWCCESLQADRVNCKGQLRAAVNQISTWVGRFNRRVSRAIPEEHLEKYDSDAEFIYDVVLMANTVHPEDRDGMKELIKAYILSTSNSRNEETNNQQKTA